MSGNVLKDRIRKKYIHEKLKETLATVK